MSHWAPHGHELAVSITASASIMLGGSSSLDAIVTNLGLNDEVDVEFLLLINSTVVNSKLYSFCKQVIRICSAFYGSPQLREHTT